jgi:hypothetical protein
LRLQPAPSDEQVEAMLGGLMPLVFIEAAKSFELARRSTAPGEPVELRDLYLRQAARLSKPSCRSPTRWPTAVTRAAGS